jgi:hypothetical protein
VTPETSYLLLRAWVQQQGSLSQLSRFLTFVNFGNPDEQWLEIQWGGRPLRLEIRDETIRLIAGETLHITQDARNSLTVRHTPEA